MSRSGMSAWMDRRNNYLLTVGWAAFVVMNAALVANPFWIGIR